MKLSKNRLDALRIFFKSFGIFPRIFYLSSTRNARNDFFLDNVSSTSLVQPRVHRCAKKIKRSTWTLDSQIHFNLFFRCETERLGSLLQIKDGREEDDRDEREIETRKNACANAFVSVYKIIYRAVAQAANAYKPFSLRIRIIFDLVTIVIVLARLADASANDALREFLHEMLFLRTLTFILEADRTGDRRTRVVLRAIFVDGVNVRNAMFSRFIDRGFLLASTSLLIRTNGSFYAIAFLRFRARIAENDRFPANVVHRVIAIDANASFSSAGRVRLKDQTLLILRADKIQGLGHLKALLLIRRGHVTFNAFALTSTRIAKAIVQLAIYLVLARVINRRYGWFLLLRSCC